MHRSTPTLVTFRLFVVVRTALLAALVLHRRVTDRDERGDVPGWVLITVMTAGLVAGLWAIAGPALEGMLRQALDSVR
ncbi:MAG: hypothetical protein AVDCRST_MAG24-998 [uncultured Nocardioidaceae bacterium]|uniref:Uncharacterized protein n=1 Tax=uncultured Nocardioidaceae bacterium TaxID=253824 RepID=A0A6J4LKX5_9ACTN|nr:MAG: hypothetical protein AVDCRST_MAG24-998 [uncultured Nocardioidaceae bacterium]